MRSLPSRLLSIGAALTLGAATLAAQAPSTDAPRAPRARQEQPRAGRTPGGFLLRDITLTEAQQTRVKALQQQFAEQRRQLVGDRQTRRAQQGATGQSQRPDSATRAARRAEREAMRGKMQQLTERQVADLRAVLTPAQQPTFDKNAATMKQRMVQRGEGRGPRGGFRRGAQGDGQAHAGHGATSGR
jgi:Spy/CpxP family protein refolding chaperone